MRPAIASLGLVAALFAACGGKPAGEVVTPAALAKEANAAAHEPLGDEEIRALVARVQAARQLGERRPIAIEQLLPKQFEALVLALIAEGNEAEQAKREAAAERRGQAHVGDEDGFLLGFDLLPPPGERDGIASADEVLTEQVVGLYHRRRDRLFVRIAPQHSEQDRVKLRAVMAHEVHHALQAQNFDMTALDGAPNDDVALARLALIEGDAMVAMGAYLGAEYGAPVRRTLRQLTDVIAKAVKVDDLVANEGGRSDEKLDRALPITQKRLSFPYEEGMRFVTDLYRAGGFELVDRAYLEPPESTAEILHPERYIAGMKPVSVAELPLPKGFREASSGVLGELQTQVVLSRCNPPEVAEAAAAGWAGDRFTVAVGADGRVALLWRSVWDRDEDAAEFVRAVAGATCWQDNAIAQGGVEAKASARLATVQRGRHAAVVRGLDTLEGRQLAARLLDVATKTPAPKPLGDLRIPPREALPEPVPGAVFGDVYRSEWLGVHGQLPAGMTYEIDSDEEEFELHIERSGAIAIGRMLVSDRVTTDEFNEIAFRQAGEAMAKAVGGRGLAGVSGGESRIPLGRAIERTWRVVGTRLHLRLVYVPICAGTGALVFLHAYGDDYAWRVLDGWMRAFTWTKGRNVPVCRRLDPK